jgi:hypothetical protein
MVSLAAGALHNAYLSHSLASKRSKFIVDDHYVMCAQCGQFATFRDQKSTPYYRRSQEVFV